MRLFSARAAMWLRVAVAGGVAAVLAVTTGIAFGSESGNAPSVTTKAPDPASALVVRNGANNASGGSTNEAEFELCFNQQIQTITAGSAASDSFLEHLRLIGYGGYGGDNTSSYGGGSATPGSVGGSPSFSPDQTVQLGGSSGAGGFTLPNSSPGNGSAYTYTGSAANNPSDPKCVNVTLTPSTSSEPGIDLNSFTQIAVDEGAGMGLSGLPTTPATIGLAPVGTPEVAPLAGGSTGPKLLSITKSGSSPQTLTYVFNYMLDPKSVTAGTTFAPGCPNSLFNPSPGQGFAYWDSGGTEHFGCTATVSGNTVTVNFGQTITNDTYYEVYPQAVFTQTTEVPDPGTARGGTIASVPTLQSVAKAPGVAGAYDLTYDQCITSNDDKQFAAVLEDNTVIQGTSGHPAGVSSRPGSDCHMIRVTFGSVNNFADFASKVVKIVDMGGAVKQQASPNNTSALGEAAVSTPPNMMEGFTDGPNLIGFKLDMTNSTATYTFDSQYGALARNNGQPIADDFGLLYADGANSIDLPSYPSQATFTGPNQVTVQFNPNQVKNVVGGIIGTADADEPYSCKTSSSPCDGSFAVQDFQLKGNVAPLTSGIGTGSTTTTTTSSRTTTTTRTSTGTTTTTTHRVVHHKKHKKHKCRKGTVRRHGKCVKKHKRRRHRRH